MKRTTGLLIVVFSVLQFGFSVSAFAQTGAVMFHGSQGQVVIPLSDNYTAADVGVRAHTNVRIFLPDGGPTPAELPPFTGYLYETPASLACVYGLVPQVPGCNPNDTVTDASGGSKSIAIVDAYDDPDAASDLAVFSSQFGLPAANLSVVYARGSEPQQDPTGGWELEESLDIEMAHAMAPNAKLYLVETPTNSFTDLFNGVSVATNLVVCGERACPHGGNGQGEISMGWGGSEFSGEQFYDRLMNNFGVVDFAAAGDEPGVEYPCTSPNVVCVGGTSTARNLSTGNLLYQVAWMDAAGGVSAYEPRPLYQRAISAIVGPYRGVPDVSFDGGPATGVWIYDSIPYESAPGEFLPTGWLVAYGTSVGSPALAGIVNAAGHFYSSSFAELQTIYSDPYSASDFNDVTLGFCGPYVGFAATPGWDFCTGVGTPFGYGGK